ncbi:MAG: hypothetical protein M3Q15_05590 [Pseudomonadota bacterium]|nr:hypothetical protein [Pseudomonadota bacterium]
MATDEGIAAIALPEEQLRYMLAQTVLTTQTAGMQFYALGYDEGCRIFEDAVDTAVDRHLPQWRVNLAVAYRDKVPSTELAKAVNESPKVAREMLSGHLTAVGTDMQTSSKSLLSQARNEVLEALFAAGSKIDRGSIDPERRAAELRDITAERKICGFDPSSSTGA